MPEGSRSKSRSASSSSSSSSSVSTTDGEGLSVIRVDSSEAGLVLGRGGATKRKIENAADVDIELVTTEEGDSNVELRGPGNNRELGRDYICFLLLHKKGESLDINLEDRDDCTWIDVPQDTIGYVTGRERSTMNSMEEETDTLMFFLDKGKHAGDGDAKPTEKLLIFGPARGRRIAQLKVGSKTDAFYLSSNALASESLSFWVRQLMSAIETKSPGFFLEDEERWNLGDKHDPKLGLTTVKMTEGQFTYALGRRGTTRRKLEKASGAIMEYIGYTAFICGTKEERRRGRDYLNYLLDQREGEVHVDTDRRDDITIIDCPEEYVGYITGHRGSELRLVEDRTGTFCFMDGADASGDVGGGGKRHADGCSFTTVVFQRGGQPEGEEEDDRHRGKVMRYWAIVDSSTLVIIFWQRRDDDDYGYHHDHHHSRHSKENPSRLLVLCFDPLRRDDAEERIRDRIEERVRQDIERGIRVPKTFDNKHSNEEVEARREEKWGPRPLQQPEKDNNDKDDEEDSGEREASPRSVSLEGDIREKSQHSKRWSSSSSSSRRSRSHSASAGRKRSRSKDDDDTEEREEAGSHHEDLSPSRDDKRSSREVEDRSSSGKRRRSPSPSAEKHHHDSPSEERDDRLDRSRSRSFRDRENEES
ncbi:hypothetical protein FOZ63_029546, partial [Perkinsus olseni]